MSKIHFFITAVIKIQFSQCNCITRKQGSSGSGFMVWVSLTRLMVVSLSRYTGNTRPASHLTWSAADRKTWVKLCFKHTLCLNRLCLQYKVHCFDSQTVPAHTSVLLWELEIWLYLNNGSYLQAYTDYSDSVSRRMGFIPLPLALLVSHSTWEFLLILSTL